MTSNLRERYAEALRVALHVASHAEGMSASAHDLADAVLAVRDHEIEWFHGLLIRAFDLADEAIPYVGVYFDEKWGLTERLDELRQEPTWDDHLAEELARAGLLKGGVSDQAQGKTDPG